MGGLAKMPVVVVIFVDSVGTPVTHIAGLHPHILV